MNILATVGCSNFKFDRLFKILDSLCARGVIEGKSLFAQTGKIGYEIQNYRHFEFASNEEMNALQERADLIICHAGTGSVVGALKKGKKVIAFPRLQKFNEHESDHQLDLATEFVAKEYIMCAMDESQLEEAIQKAPSFSAKPFISNKDNFVALICQLIQEG